MKPQRGRRAALAALGVFVPLALSACSDEAISAPSAEPIATESSNLAADDIVEVEPPTVPPTVGVSSTGATSPVVEPIEGDAIPGLDSDDKFCAAWSRFAGSFQIVTPAWLVATDPNENVNPGQLEAAAAQTMVAAYYDMGQNWPAAIGDAKDSSLGVYQAMFQRMERDLGYLRDAGATDEQLVGIASWWETQLAGFDGFTFPSIDGAPSTWRPLVEQAGATILAEELPVPEDPQLVNSSEPLVELFSYLAENCPDQGLLSGREVLDG